MACVMSDLMSPTSIEDSGRGPSASEIIGLGGLALDCASMLAQLWVDFSGIRLLLARFVVVVLDSQPPVDPTASVLALVV